MIYILYHIRHSPRRMSLHLSNSKAKSISTECISVSKQSVVVIGHMQYIISKCFVGTAE